MLASLAAFAAAAVLSAEAIVEAHADAAMQADTPLLVAHADGSWTITRAIHEGPAGLEAAADVLQTADVEDLRFAGDLEAREEMRALELEDQFERAFEEAVDKAREFELPE
jgi:hypothetical protein